MSLECYPLQHVECYFKDAHHRTWTDTLGRIRFKSNVSAIPPDGHQLGRTRTPTLHYERNALPVKLLAHWEWRDSNPQPFGLDLQSNALTSSATLPMPPKGIEPLSSDYKTDILPIKLRRYNRIKKKHLRVGRLELPRIKQCILNTSCLPISSHSQIS